MTTTSLRSRDRWALEAKRRIGVDFEKIAMAFVVQRAAVSERILRLYGFSKTQQRKAEVDSDIWLRGRLTRLCALEIILDRHKILGWLIWWMHDRLLKRMKRQVLFRPGPPAPPASQPDLAGAANSGKPTPGWSPWKKNPAEGASDGPAAAQTVPQA
jgi:hypothetical protein